MVDGSKPPEPDKEVLVPIAIKLHWLLNSELLLDPPIMIES